MPGDGGETRIASAGPRRRSAFVSVLVDKVAPIGRPSGAANTFRSAALKEDGGSDPSVFASSIEIGVRLRDQTVKTNRFPSAETLGSAVRPSTLSSLCGCEPSFSARLMSLPRQKRMCPSGSKSASCETMDPRRRGSPLGSGTAHKGSTSPSPAAPSRYDPSWLSAVNWKLGSRLGTMVVGPPVAATCMIL